MTPYDTYVEPDTFSERRGAGSEEKRATYHAWLTRELENMRVRVQHQHGESCTDWRGLTAAIPYRA